MALGKRYGSVKKARASLKKGSGSSEYLWRLKADEQWNVRFLQEPPDWFEAAQHYVGGEFIWCTDPEKFKNCEQCQSGDRPAKRALANVLDRETGKVRILQMTKQLADSVVGKVDRPITSADYVIWREGSGKDDTKYGADRLDASKCDLSRYKLHDIEAALIAELGFDPEADEDEDDEEDEEPRSTRKASSKNSSKRRRPEPEEEDEEDEDEEERPRRSSKPNPRPARRSSHVDEDDEEDEDDDEDEEDDEDEPPARSRRTSSSRAASSSRRPVKKSRSRDDGYDEFKPEKSRHPEAARARKLRK